MKYCYYCDEEFTDENPAIRAVAYVDSEGQPQTGLICQRCSEELETTSQASEQQ